MIFLEGGINIKGGGWVISIQDLRREGFAFPINNRKELLLPECQKKEKKVKIFLVL